MRPLVMVGGGTGALARIIAEATKARGAPLAGYLDVGAVMQPPTTPIARLGDEDRLNDAAFIAAFDFVVAVQGASRRALCEAILKKGGAAPALVHPAAHISTTASLGAGTVASAGVIVQSDARIGRFCVLNTACTLDHDNVVGDWVSVGPGAHTAGRVTIAEEAFVGLGAVIINDVKIGRRATIGAGAVVIRDVADGVTVVGNPARAIIPGKPSSL